MSFFLSRVRINIRPKSLDFLSLHFGLLAIARRSVESLGSKTFVHFVFEVAAHAHRFPEETSRVAFF
jgi:hypothetical protein